MNEERLYRLRTPASGRFHEEVRRHLPGGDSRSTLFYPPYPAVLDRGEGCRVWDLDGNSLLDLTGNHSILVHGYHHPAVTDAISALVNLGYPQVQASAAVAAAMKQAGDEAEAKTLIRLGLRELAR